MNKQNHDANLYFLAAVCFLIAAAAGEMVAFYPIACCMLVLGILKMKKK